jgi:hypothetical protein
MTQKLFEMAVKAGLQRPEGISEFAYLDRLEFLESMIRADEREQCAKVCEGLSPKTEPVEYGDIRWGWKYKCPYARAIRARGDK